MYHQINLCIQDKKQGGAIIKAGVIIGTNNTIENVIRSQKLITVQQKERDAALYFLSFV